ncbi:excinuclease ABC subunit UvrC [endosymbiont of unidentified scaly snail isolate Monju]|uniref:excinuclease ABC subunit UvrC n=1 Tax=endosymbiont of unidentified scaly snail isolate Monju TaxID=1248727 RepID=UPI0003892721|nr:excinuclease ABC subunit UvrC [endosymbiont of unidentified scaly snail isolate Monju]BAN69026.1 excinuclease ABC subunit C [endosymbiont of unidentified scaly snail isolate Monju]
MADDTFDHKAFLATLTHRPGVYRMIGAEGEVLYAGKARDLAKRVASYFTRAANRRIEMMVSQIRDIQITVTHTEAEALILENHLIKEHRPRYNVLLRDDKSYPYIHLSDDEFPRLAFHRGARTGGGRYFGPYPSAGAVRETLKLLQKLFPVRQCENSQFANRSRPCLQYQIERCTAPCVGFVSPERYARDVQDTVLFLEGKASDVIDRWVARMEAAAEALEFEEAAKLRDQIAALRTVQERQYVAGERGDLDIVAAASRGGVACIQLFLVRQGRNLGNKTLYPRNSEGADEAELVSAFIAQYYLERAVPAEILVSSLPPDRELLEQALSEQAGRRVRIIARPRGERARWLQMARTNAEMAVQARLASRGAAEQRLEALQQALDLESPPRRMECFDISHTRGDQTVASCVVFQDGAPSSSDYRRFNIRGITPGDDYAALRQALQRRYARIQGGEGQMPDLLLIDGGKGQLAAVAEALSEMGINDLLILGVAKGPDRKPGMETLFLLGEQRPLILPANSPALHLVQQIRDEAHRFAITGHRQRRAKAKSRSPLEDIPGIGAKRRQRLLKHFGGLQGLARAGVEDIARVEGISKKLANAIYISFHGEE